MDAAARQAAIEAMVERVRSTAPPGWAQVYGAWEAKDDDPGGLSLTWAVLGVVSREGRWGFGAFAFDEVLYDAVLAFRRDCGDDRWTACELTVNPDGSFDTQLSYDPVPPAGAFAPDRQARLENYPQTWQAAHGPTPR